MEILALLIPAVLGGLVLRLLIQPVRLGAKLALHALSGFFCLWILNLSAPVTGVFLPINAVTALISGLFGLPGVGLIVLLAL